MNKVPSTFTWPACMSNVLSRVVVVIGDVADVVFRVRKVLSKSFVA